VSRDPLLLPIEPPSSQLEQRRENRRVSHISAEQRRRGNIKVSSHFNRGMRQLHMVVLNSNGHRSSRQFSFITSSFLILTIGIRGMTLNRINAK